MNPRRFGTYRCGCVEEEPCPVARELFVLGYYGLLRKHLFEQSVAEPASDNVPHPSHDRSGTE